MPTLKASNEDVRVYEIAVMYIPDLDQKAESTLMKELDAHFADAKGTLLFKDPWSKRGLAYKIAGYDHAKYVIYYFEMSPSVIRELDHQLRLQKGVMRHLITIPPNGYEAVSWEEKYQDWLKTRETAIEVRQRKKEDKVKEQLATSAKRAMKRKDEAKKDEKVSKPKPVKMEDLSKELDKLISDDDLKM